ncbi:hypothetical protein [Streptomyces abikoensis]|uniref:hypothetical protein n=1 Tax=Streptomyces abikoensis TaxID=97398 RepID=UPI0033C08354
MSASPRVYTPENPEAALKYAIQHIRLDHVQMIEGAIHPFGTPLHLPTPFDLELDTSDF